jgi:hypothetical protein
MNLIFTDSQGNEKFIGAVNNLEETVNLMVDDMKTRFIFPTGLIRFPFEAGAELCCGKGDNECKYSLT